MDKMERSDNEMTRREKIIISAYTGTNLAGDFAEIQQYIEEKLGRPVMTHELALAKTWDEIRYAVLCINKACYIRPMTNLIAERDEAIKEWNWRKKP